MKYLFMPLHWLIGGLIRSVDFLTSPKPMQRPAEKQSLADEATKNLTLYHYPACPFCVRVRRNIKRLNLNIRQIDPRKDADWLQKLEQEGGKVQVPCLQMVNTDGTSNWMYESSDINDYLTNQFEKM